MSTRTAMIKQLREATYASVLDCSNALKAHGDDYEKALEQLRSTSLRKAEKKAERETREGLVVVAQHEDSVCMIEINCETDFVARVSDFKSLAHRLTDQVLGDSTLTDADRLLAASFMGDPAQTVELSIKELAGKLGENIQLRQVARYEAGENAVVEGYVHAGEIEGYDPMEGRLGVLVELAVENSVDKGLLADLAHDLALHIASEEPKFVSVDDIPADEREAKIAELTEELVNEDKPENIKAKIIEGRLQKFYNQTCLLNQRFIKDDELSIDELLQQKSEELGSSIRVARFVRYQLGD